MRNYMEMTKVELVNQLVLRDQRIGKMQIAINHNRWMNRHLIKKMKRVRHQLDVIIEHPYSASLDTTRKKKSGEFDT